MKAENKIKERVINILIKWGNNPTEVKDMVDKHFDYVMEAHKDSTIKEKAEAIRTIY